MLVLLSLGLDSFITDSHSDIDYDAAIQSNFTFCGSKIACLLC